TSSPAVFRPMSVPPAAVAMHSVIVLQPPCRGKVDAAFFVDWFYAPLAVNLLSTAVGMNPSHGRLCQACANSSETPLRTIRSPAIDLVSKVDLVNHPWACFWQSG